MKTANFITILSLALLVLWEAMLIHNHGNAIKEIHQERALINVRINNLERLNQPLFEKEQEEREERVSLSNVRQIIP